MFLAVELVRQRLVRATAALDSAGIPYAVVGGHAVAAHVATVDPAATRTTQDVDILINRADLERVKAALTPAGFAYHNVNGIDLFIDGPDGRARDAVHLLYADEKVLPQSAAPSPALNESSRMPCETGQEMSIIELEALVRMKLVSFRRKDQVHLQDMLEIGQIDASWLPRFPPALAARLQELIDTPGG